MDIPTNSNKIYRNIDLSADVLKWQPKVEEYALKNDMGNYVDLILAIMMQESAGRGLDIMQCSECDFNTKYPKKPNGITDPIYSIDCGIKELNLNFKIAKVKDKDDIENIKIAVQSYNFGPGYIKFCKEKGNHSNKTAKEFSYIMALKRNWNSYGDPLYVDHVFKYCIII